MGNHYFERVIFVNSSITLSQIILSFKIKLNQKNEQYMNKEN